MMLRIERSSDDERATLRLIGRISSEHLKGLKEQIEDAGSAVSLDLDDITLVDLDAVHFLRTCEAAGIELLNCSPYVREWMAREKDREG